MTGLSTCLAAALLLSSLPAHAQEAPDPVGGLLAPRFELADVSAWTLRAGELEVGPTAVRFGIFDQLHIGTRFALNLFGALNAEAKWTIYDDRYLGIGVQAGLLRFDPDLVGIDESFSLWAFPVSLIVSARPGERFRVHGAIQFLSARPGEQASDVVLRIQRYLGPVGRLALKLGFEWRPLEVLGLVADFEAPLILHRETFRYDGEDGFGDFVRGTLALQLVVKSFNLRVGGGYGPSFFGKSGPFPVFELALRIY